MIPKSIIKLLLNYIYVLALFVFGVLLITRHNELVELITGYKSPTIDQLSRDDTDRVADYILDDLDGSGEDITLELHDDNKPEPIITDSEFWAENDRKIARRFALRKARLREFCDNYSANGHDKDWSNKPRHFYVGDGPHKLLGCVPLKTGCTSWIYWQTSQKYPNATKHSMGMAMQSGQ